MILKETEIRNSTIVLVLEEDGKKEKLALSVDDFYEFRLASGMEIDAAKLKEIKSAAEKTAVFAKCLHKLAARDRSTQEMRTWLRDTVQASSALAEEILARLKKLGYLDDERYCREQVSAMKSALKGERLITETLLKKGISEEMIRQCLSACDDEEDNAGRLAGKILRSRSKGSLKKAKDDIVTKLYQRGFSMETARRAAEDADYGDLAADQAENVRAALQKAGRRYGRKYSGRELRSRLYRYGLQQGFAADAVNAAITEMENEYEED